MICALLLGRAGSTGLPGKNTMPVLGRPMMAYPLLAAHAQPPRRARLRLDRQSRRSRRSAASTAPRSSTARRSCARPRRSARTPTGTASRSSATGSPAEGHELELLALLFANAPTVSARADRRRASTTLRADADARLRGDRLAVQHVESAARPSPRARRDAAAVRPVRDVRRPGDAQLRPRLARATSGSPTWACRSSRPRCLEHMEDGLLPQKWMGRRIAPIESWGGCDVDYEWQMPGRRVLAPRARLRGGEPPMTEQPEPLTVLLSVSSFGEADPSRPRLLEEAGARVIPNPHGRRLREEEISELIGEADAVIAGTEPLNARGAREGRTAARDLAGRRRPGERRPERRTAPRHPGAQHAGRADRLGRGDDAVGHPQRAASHRPHGPRDACRGLAPPHGRAAARAHGRDRRPRPDRPPPRRAAPPVRRDRSSRATAPRTPASPSDWACATSSSTSCSRPPTS